MMSQFRTVVRVTSPNLVRELPEHTLMKLPAGTVLVGSFCLSLPPSNLSL
jgi:hypothetical protein